MKERLVGWLCCPDCRGDLVLEQATRNEFGIESGRLRCRECDHDYPIIKSIPRFVKTDAYVGNFSFEWTVHKKTQLDSVSGNTESRDSFSEKTGTEPASLQGKMVLEAGCGMGRYLEIAQPYAQEVVGVDLSFAVDSAFGNLKKYENVHIVQADIFKLPFKPGIFDLIYSLGVLHHTPSTEQAFLMLPPLLKKNGIVAIWVYSNDSTYLQVWNAFTNFYRIFTVHIPEKLLWYLCHVAIPFYYVKKIPLLGPVLNIIFPMSNHPDAESRVLDTFDWYSPKYQYKHTYKEVLGWFSSAGLENIIRLPFPVSVKGEKKK